METFTSYLTGLRQLIGQGELSQSLLQLQHLLKGSPQLDEAVHFSARFNDVRQQIRTGTISPGDAALAKNQLTQGLLNFLKELEMQHGHSPLIREEIDQFLIARTTRQQAEKIYNINHIDHANFS